MDERRRGQRYRSLRSGKIVFNFKRSVIDCLIRNVSETGVCLQVNGTAGIPNTFDLLIDGEEGAKPCRIVWRTDSRIGIEFRDQINANPRRPAALVQDAAAESQHAGSGPFRGEMIALRAALDVVPIGIVLLDGDMRARFINRAFRKMWRLPDAMAESNPPFTALMYHGRDTRAYAIPSGDLDAYVAARVAHIKSGDPRPLDLRLTSGEVIRMQATELPNGGRLLSYTYVTDIVSHADELERLRAALDNSKQGVVLLDPMLNVEFMNRAVRELWGVPDEMVERKAPFIELVTDACRTGAFKVPAEDIAKFVASRIAIARAGEPTPTDIPHRDGRIIRVQCSALPNGGRMFTYAEVTDLIDRADQFEELAAIDGLTGVYNRRQFNALAQAEWGRFQRYHRSLSVLLIDIDRFKDVNDRHGHDAGDRAIAHVAQLCRQAKRSTDILARVGGDEFILLLPETNIVQARLVAERLHETVLQTPLRDEDRRESIPLTVSIGIAEAKLSMPNHEAAIKLADEALYRAKAKGRDCIAVADAASTAVHHAAE